jgi:hypothetical protein
MRSFKLHKRKHGGVAKMTHHMNGKQRSGTELSVSTVARIARGALFHLKNL